MPLFIDRQDIHRLAQARHLLFMVGSYDGNPNMGDVLQLAGAVGALTALTKFVTPVILIEAERYDSHRAICGCHPDVFADAVILAPRRFVWNATLTMTPLVAGVRWACGQVACRPVHMSTGRYFDEGARS